MKTSPTTSKSKRYLVISLVILLILFVVFLHFHHSNRPQAIGDDTDTVVSATKSVTLSATPDNIDEDVPLWKDPSMFFTCISTYAPPEATTPESQEKYIEHVERLLDSLRKANTRGRILVVDDASPISYHYQLNALQSKYNFELFRKDVNGGVAKAKNTCIRAFWESSAEFLFMLDDDIIILKEGWQEAYARRMVEGKQGMLSWYQDSKKHCTIWSEYPEIRLTPLVMGVCLVLTRHTVRTIGGFYIFPQKYGHEHTEYHRRAIRMGLTNTFMDIADGEEYIQMLGRPSPVNNEDRQTGLSQNGWFLGFLTDEKHAKSQNRKLPRFVDVVEGPLCHHTDKVRPISKKQEEYFKIMAEAREERRPGALDS